MSMVFRESSEGKMKYQVGYEFRDCWWQTWLPPLCLSEAIPLGWCREKFRDDDFWARSKNNDSDRRRAMERAEKVEITFEKSVRLKCEQKLKI